MALSLSLYVCARERECSESIQLKMVAMHGGLQNEKMIPKNLYSNGQMCNETRREDPEPSNPLILMQVVGYCS